LEFYCSQVLSNFVSNAIKFSPDLGSIELGVRFLGWGEIHQNLNSAGEQEPRVAALELNVTDTGIGISVEDQQKLFQPFSQIRAGDLQQGRGSGLGLCIARHIAQLMGGTIGVRSKPEAGSTFFIAVALAEAKQPVASSSPTSPSLPSALPRGPGGADTHRYSPSRVLIADDVTSNRKLIRRCLEQLGFTCDEAADGAEAVKMCGLNRYNLVLMDHVSA